METSRDIFILTFGQYSSLRCIHKASHHCLWLWQSLKMRCYGAVPSPRNDSDDPKHSSIPSDLRLAKLVSKEINRLSLFFFLANFCVCLSAC
jgi:hypothetical protein